MEIQIFHIDYLAQLFSLLCLFLDLLDLGLELLLSDHALGGVLEVQEIVFEFVALQVLHDIGCKFCTLELSYSDGPVRRYQQLVQNTVEL